MDVATADSVINLALARSIVDKIVILEKGWKVDISVFEMFEALPADIKKGVAKYGEDTRAKGVIHKGSVYVVSGAHSSETGTATSLRIIDTESEIGEFWYGLGDHL